MLHQPPTRQSRQTQPQAGWQGWEWLHWGSNTRKVEEEEGNLLISQATRNVMSAFFFFNNITIAMWEREQHADEMSHTVKWCIYKWVKHCERTHMFPPKICLIDVVMIKNSKCSQKKSLPSTFQKQMCTARSVIVLLEEKNAEKAPNTWLNLVHLWSDIKLTAE